MNFSLIPRFFLVAFGLIALESRADDFTWNGFVAQGIIQAQDSNFVESNGDVSLKLTELGVNASYRISNHLRLAGQAVYLNGGNRYTEGVRMDYLFLDWQVYSDTDWLFNIHLGRYKNYHWLYSSTRDVPHTRPSIVLPQSSYFDIFRDVALGSDGLAIRANRTSEIGDWQFNWSYGSSNISQEQMTNLLAPTATGELKQDFDHQMSLSWTSTESTWQFGFNLLDSDFVYHAGANDAFVGGKVTTQRLMVNAAYHSQNWELVTELVKERVILDNVVFNTFENDTTAEGGFVQWRYFVKRDQTLMLRFDLYDRNRKNRNGSMLPQQTGGLSLSYFGYMDQATVGYSWDFEQNWRVQAEYHKIKGAGRLAPVIIPDLEVNADKYWDMWAVQLMYWF
jgi:hypothetical protein